MPDLHFGAQEQHRSRRLNDANRMKIAIRRRKT